MSYAGTQLAPGWPQPRYPAGTESQVAPSLSERPWDWMVNERGVWIWDVNTFCY